jgi:tRNA A-37 threonylcarbamoyl transferase component Bud32
VGLKTLKGMPACNFTFIVEYQLYYHSNRRKLGESLLAIHRHGVAHKDMAERNVVLNEKGDPFVIDFELSSDDHKCPANGCAEIQEMNARLCL